MGRIGEKFAPLTQSLGEDQRFITESTDLDKLLYLLIIYTCHMTNHQAPVDPRFYKIRFGLRSKGGQIAASLCRIRDMYPKLSWGDKKLSLLNSATYEIQNVPRIRKEVEKKEKRGERTPNIEEVKALFREKGFPAEAEKFFDYYEANGWRVGKNPMRKWQSAAANWIRNGISLGKAEAGPKSFKANCPRCGGKGHIAPSGRECWCWRDAA